jgi:hypothetical protein
MKLLNKLIGTIGLSIALCGIAQANLIQNGSFEDVGGDAYAPGSWGLYSSIPEWDASNNIEIWDTPFLGVNAVDGIRVAELNAHPVGEFSLYQDFATEIGQLYELTFSAQKRNNNSEMFNVSVSNTAAVLSDDISSHTNDVWQVFTYTFTATTESSTLTFHSLDGANDTTGNLLDAVSVTGQPNTKSIPEPGVLILMLFGLMGVFVSRKSLTCNK